MGYYSDSDDESVIDVDDVDMDIDCWEPSETEQASEPSNIPYIHEEEGDAQLTPTSNDDQNAVTQDDLTTEEEEHIDIINPRPDPITEVPLEPPESEDKGEHEPSTPTPTKKPRTDFKGVPTSTEELRAAFKGVPSSTKPPEPNPEEPPEPNPGETTGSNIEGVPWDNSEIKETAIPGSKANRNWKQRERHRGYTRTCHKVSSSRKRCVGKDLPAISDDRTRSHKVRCGGKHRRHSRVGCAANHWRWLLRSRRWQ